jgi:hypothetical protein
MRPQAAHERLPHIVLMLALALFGCGGSGNRQPTGPSVGPTPTPAAPAPEFRDGWTEQALPAGIAPSAPRMGDGVIVRAPGYLAREAHFRGEPFFLWPAEEGYVRQVIYTNTNGVPAAMRRYDRSSIVITPDGEIARDPAVMDVLLKVAAESSGATGIPISVGPNGQVHVIVDGSQPLFENNTAAAFTQNAMSGNTVVSSRLYFPEAKWITGATRLTYDNTALHEMGHALGLFHSTDPQDVMFAGQGRQNQRYEFSPREHVNLKLMYRFRKPGNLPPDRDSALGPAQAPALRHEVIVE